MKGKHPEGVSVSTVISLLCHHAVWPSNPVTHSRLHQIIVSAGNKEREREKEGTSRYQDGSNEDFGLTAEQMAVIMCNDDPGSGRIITARGN